MFYRLFPGFYWLWILSLIAICCLKFNLLRIRIRIIYWWNAETTITHQDLIRELDTSSHKRSELSNTILCIFSGWDQRIGEGIPIPDSLGEECTFINICIGNGSLKCHRVLISTTPSFGDKVICWYTGFTLRPLYSNISLLFFLLFLRDSHFNCPRMPVILTVS